jgi:hypothetical protein
MNIRQIYAQGKWDAEMSEMGVRGDRATGCAGGMDLYQGKHKSIPRGIMSTRLEGVWLLHYIPDDNPRITLLKVTDLRSWQVVPPHDRAPARSTRLMIGTRIKDWRTETTERAWKAARRIEVRMRPTDWRSEQLRKIEDSGIVDKTEECDRVTRLEGDWKDLDRKMRMIWY